MKKKIISLLCILGMVFTMPGCASGDNNLLPVHVIDDAYRTFYEVFVYSFYDSDGDGIGDLAGLTKKLDYINDGDDKTTADLGCNGIWLMPVMPSTTYHKYDVIDYCDIDPQYGTMEDFDVFMAACEERDIHVLVDLVLNHTSSKHPWFVAACEYLKQLGDEEPSREDCPYFDYYHFSKEKLSGTYYEVAGTDWYYEAPFWSEMPDLNLSSEAVRGEIATITQFWLDKGVTGFRLDAAKEYVSDHTAENVEILSWLNETVKAQKEDAYIVAEVWTDAATYESYYKSGIDSCFEFAYGSQDGIIAKTLNGKNGNNALTYGQNLEVETIRLNENYANAIPAPFYTNHDMGRSAGYYAGEGSEEKTKLAQAMNLLMSGNAFLYYGEELGMKGSGKDENKRAPMYWAEDPKAEGMCVGPVEMDSFEMKFESLTTQEADPNSIYQYVKKVIQIRNAFPEIARGVTTLEEKLSNEQVCVLRKNYGEQELILIYNISSSPVTLDTSSLTVNGDKLSKKNFQVGLFVWDGDSVTYEGAKIIIPAYGVMVYQ